MDHVQAPDATLSAGIDVQALRARYRLERDKRMQAATRTYHEPTGDFASFVDDPYTDGIAERAPLADEVEVAIIGGGFGGLLIGARLRQAGYQDIRVIDKASDFGGTWYWNRFPGARCDIESYVYMPLLEEVGYLPTEKYASGPEILAYSQALARRFDLYRNALFQTQVTELRWDEGDGRWTVYSNRGDRIRARFVAMALGSLHRPRLPAIEGIDEFEQPIFHTSRWDYDYTGGDSSGGMTKLADKRVGVIGTGATGVQAIPMLGRYARELYVFQRTPSSIDFRGNQPTDEHWAGALQPGWQQHRMDNFNTLTCGGIAGEDLVHDAWTRTVMALAVQLGGRKHADPAAAAASAELADFAQMERIRSRVDQVVSDPTTAELLKPYYRQFCKRPCFHDHYLDTFNRPNVTLVDTDGRGPDRFTPRGVMVGDREYPLDCMILASGFEYQTEFVRRAEYDIVGRDGLALSAKWGDGPRTLHGMHVHGFPNCFILSSIQSAQAPNVVHVLNEQSKHLGYILGHAKEHGVTRIEASRAGEDAWVDTVREKAVNNLAFLEACTPGIYNNEGRPSERSVLGGAYGGGCLEFFERLDDWRHAGALEGLELTRAAVVATDRG